MQRHTRTFRARDEGGREVAVKVFVTFRPAPTRADPGRQVRVGTPPRLVTEDGRRVTQTSAMEFEIAGTGEKLTTDEPIDPG
jgi:hypothetical protein